MKNEGLKIGKIAIKQISEKIIPAAIDLAGNKTADKMSVLSNKPEEQTE